MGFLKISYINWTNIIFIRIKELSSSIETHHHDDLEKDHTIKTHGYTLPGYNFYGAQNSMDWVSSTMFDAICMNHDQVCANKQHSFERDLTDNLIDNWDKAKLGDDWTGRKSYK